MSDLISRQAAIDALKDVSEHYTDKGREWHPHVDFMVEAIQDLPSAQRWIPVTKSLPKDNEYVLVTTAEGGVTDAEYWHRERIWVKNLAIMHVTAWMPLPEPWRGENDGMDC